jgi:PKD domain
MRLFRLPVLLFLLSTPLYAQDAEKVAAETRIAKQGATENGDRGLFTIPSVETLNKNQFSFGYGWNGINRAPGDLTITSLPVFLSYGLLGRLTLTGTFNTQEQLTAHSLAEPGYNTAYPFVRQQFTKGYGDTLLTGKYRFLRRSDNVGGMSFRGFVKFPTTQSSSLGTGATDVGADVIFTSRLPFKFLIDSSIGYTSLGNAKDPVSGATLRLKNGLRSGLGAAWPAGGLQILNGSVQGIFEYSTLSFVGGGSSNASSSTQNSSDIGGGLRYLMLDAGLTLNAGYRTNTKSDSVLPGNGRKDGFTFSVSYTKPVRTPGNNRFPVVSLERSSDQIAVGGSATITATGYDADNDPLTYSWFTSGGQIVGSGEKVTFNATGVTPGTYTIRATVSDGKGGTGTAMIDLTVRP